MQTTATQKTDGEVIWHDTQILPKVAPEFFDADWHQRQGGVLGSATGRGCAHFLQFEGHDLVLRPFRRGGLIGKMIADLFLRVGALRSRAYREFALLGWMREQGLPVPKPVAARYVPVWFWYRADLVTELIPQSRTLADVLLDQKLPTATWSQVGSVIRQMHHLGVHHSDLNCRNILLDAQMQVWLIDFDKCSRRTGDHWKTQNLERLKRSLEKERSKTPALHWEVADWAALLAGYSDETA